MTTPPHDIIGCRRNCRAVPRHDRNLLSHASSPARYVRAVRSSSLRPSPRTIAAAILGLAGVGHFVIPAAFDKIVPTWMPGSARVTTYVSGAVELTVAALLLSGKRRKLAGYLAFATFLGVFPANVQAALDGGINGAPPPLDSALAAWLRLPFQIPLLWLAWRTIKDADR